MNYKGYRLKEKGWQHDYVVMFDKYDNCIGATRTTDQAMRWIDHVEHMKVTAKNYRPQT